MENKESSSKLPYIVLIITLFLGSISYIGYLSYSKNKGSADKENEFLALKESILKSKDSLQTEVNFLKKESIVKDSIASVWKVKSLTSDKKALSVIKERNKLLSSIKEMSPDSLYAILTSYKVKGDSSNTYKPTFFGKKSDTTIFSFNVAQTKGLVSDIITSRESEKLDSTRISQISARDSLNAVLTSNLSVKDSTIKKLERIQSKDEILLNAQDEALTDKVEKLNNAARKIKLLKIERIAYPALVAILAGLYIIK